MGQCSLFVRRPQLAPVVRTGEQWPHGPTEAVCVRGAGGGRKRSFGAPRGQRRPLRPLSSEMVLFAPPISRSRAVPQMALCE